MCVKRNIAELDEEETWRRWKNHKNPCQLGGTPDKKHFKKLLSEVKRKKKILIILLDLLRELEKNMNVKQKHSRTVRNIGERSSVNII